MNSKLFRQFKNNNKEKREHKKSLSKEKNLTSSRKKASNSYKKSITENNNTLNTLNNINNLNIRTNNTNKKRKINFNTRKINQEIYNLKKNILDKKMNISKKEIKNIINKKENIKIPKKVNNLSINSAKSESEEKKKYEENYNNKLSYELILPNNNEYQPQNTSINQNKLTINRNFSPIGNSLISMTYNKNFSIKNKDNDIIKVNLYENKKEKKSIKKEASYAISNSNTNSNTNSRNITNYFNDNKINKNIFFDISNFNKDIKEILNIKESIALLKEQLKADNHPISNLNYINKIKSKINQNKGNVHKQKLLYTRNEIKHNHLDTNATIQKIQFNKTINNKIEKIKSDKKIYIHQNKTKSNFNNILQVSKDSKRSSFSSKKFNRGNNTCKHFFTQKIKGKYNLKSNSNKNISNTEINKKYNGTNSHKSYKVARYSNISKIYKFSKKNNGEDKNYSSIVNREESLNIENKIKKLNKNKFLKAIENKASSYRKKYNHENMPKLNYESMILSRSIPISNSINSSLINDLNPNNKNIKKFKNLRFEIYKNKNKFSFNMKLKNQNDSKNLIKNKSNLLLPILRRKTKKEGDNELIKNIDHIEIISKPGEPVFGTTKINQDNLFCTDLIDDYKFIGVCDGHGEYGHHVSKFIKNTLPLELNNNLQQVLSIKNIINDFYEQNKININNIEFQELKEILNKSHAITNNKLLLKNSINEFDLRLSGSTCVSILFDSKKMNKLYISNIGDSRALIIKKNIYKYWTCHQLSRDHKPIEKDESSRIYKCGGEIQKLKDEQGGWIGPLRVWVKDGIGPGLAMTRSFGDIVGSSIGIISSPEISEYLIQKEDKAIIIASDGLWEYLSNKEVTNIVKKAINRKENNKIVNMLYKESYKKWKSKDKGIDDLTIICIVLKSI